MERVLYLFAVIALCLLSVKGENTYTAAVVEYGTVQESTPHKTVLKNLNLYRQYVEQAKNKHADIIVFPEYGLTSVVVDNPEVYAVDLSGSGKFDVKVLEEVKSIAKDNNIYLVVNLLEKAVRPKKTKYYNTNLVVDRKGNVIAKYHKVNLFNEPKLTPGKETVTFTTDFGVTFGIFTCWDIVFKTPTRDVVTKYGATDIVYPLAWFSTMPFYMALSIQHGYVLENGVNLLVSNYHNVTVGNGGSGIFLANGKIAEAYVSEKSDNKLIVQTIKKNTKKSTCGEATSKSDGSDQIQTSVSNFITHRDFVDEDYAFKDIDLTKSKSSEEVCSGKFCCTFDVEVAEANTKENYKLMAFDGMVELDNTIGHVRTCSLVACKNDKPDSCGHRISGTTKFSKISLNGDLPYEKEAFYQPETLRNNLLPITDSTYCTTVKNQTISVKLATTKAQDDLLVFGIYGRVSPPSA